MLRVDRARQAGSRKKDSGYMLLFLMLTVAIMTITLLGVARNYRRSILRDREVEMMHRGDQYSRAIKRFYHKNGRYPISLEQLENTNNIRYLRKRYKDPMSPDGTWKLVHATDVKLKPGGGLATGTPNTGLGAATGAANATATTGSAFGSSQSASGTASGLGTPDSDTTTGTSTTSTGTVADTGTTASGSGATGNAAAGQVLGGGDIWGVVSKQKTEGIHSFGDKSKYNEWFFIYIPDQDRNQLLVGPYNPNMVVGGANAGIGNTNGSSSSGSGTTTGQTPGTVAPTSSPAQPTPTSTP